MMNGVQSIGLTEADVDGFNTMQYHWLHKKLSEMKFQTMSPGIFTIPRSKIAS